MPDITKCIDDVPGSYKPHLPKLIFKYDELGFIKQGKSCFVYRYPTLRECLKFQKAAAFHPVNACLEMLEHLILLQPSNHSFLDYDIEDAFNLVMAIVDDSYINKEEILDEVDAHSNLIDNDMASSLETYSKAISNNDDYWDMNKPEIIKRLGMSQIILGKRIRENKKSDKRTK